MGINSKHNPIGFFDSGIGGTSIWKEVVDLLPNEDTIFLADSKNAPYGEKSKEDIVGFCIKNTEFLLKKGCKLIVVACNTATTNAIAYLREYYDVPFIGIEPAIKPAALHTKSKKVGVLATRGTLTSELFNKTSELYTSGIEVIEQHGDGIVDLVETGKINSNELFNLLEKYLIPMIAHNIDYLVLGCTHYPYLIPIIRKIVPANVTIIDSGEAVANQTEHVLRVLGKLTETKEANHYFYTNVDEQVLINFLPLDRLNIHVTHKNF